MRYKLILPVVALCLFEIQPSFAQNEVDALRYSWLSPGPTARSIGLGGAGGSYGGDFSSININPAGLGIYRHSKIMITPALRINGAQSTYLNSKTKDHNSHLNINNFGVVFSHAATGKEYEKSDWKAYSFAIGYNRLADFNSDITYSGLNNQSSFSDILSADAKNYGIKDNIAPPFGYLGYEGYLLDDNFNPIPQGIINSGGSLLQTKNIQTSGGVGDWTLAFGGNYKEKLMLGLSLDMLSYKYHRQSYFTEEDATNNPNNDFASMTYHEDLSTSGLGFNLKLGAIYVASNNFRFGVALHTPTWSSFNDVSTYDLSSNTEGYKAATNQPNTNPITNVQPSAPGYTFDYSLRTPWRGLLSATYFLGRHGFITADYSYVDYSSMKYNFGQGYSNVEHAVNQAIKDTYKGGHNIRIGAEGRQGQFMERIGFAYHTSPYRESQDFDGQSMDISAGIGVRVSDFSIDLGYMHRIYKTAQYAYPLLVTGVVTGIAQIQQNKNIAVLTLGYQF